jgi:hypothetical protein
MQIDTLGESELGPNFRVPMDHSDGEHDDDILEVEDPTRKKRKTPSAPIKAKAQGGQSTAALEKKKRQRASSVEIIEDDAPLENAPIAKK